MKDTLTSANHRDFRQRYEGTFGFFSPDGRSPLLVQLDTVEPSRVNFKDKRGTSYHANVDSGIPFEFIQVQRRVVNFADDDVIYISRKPARMWRRGLCADNTSITNLKTMRRAALNFATVESAYQNNITYESAVIEFLAGNRKNVAVDDKFSIIGGALYLYDTVIGSYADKTVKVSHIFKQEFSDLVRRKVLPITVEIINE